LIKYLAALIIIISGLPLNVWSDNSVLLVVDMQKGLLDTQSAQHIAKPMLCEVINNVNDNIRKANAKHIPILYIRNESNNSFQNFFTGNVCKAGSKQAEIDNRVLKDTNALVFVKNSPSTFSNTSFVKYIDENNFDKIFICGLMAEGCINATAMEGLKRHKRFLMVEPAIGSQYIWLKNWMIKKYRKKGLQIVSGL